jgi:hypothetical protein
MGITDEEAAAWAITAITNLSQEQEAAQSKIKELLKDSGEDSFADIHEFFGLYNVLYFRAYLIPRVEVSWSPKLTVYVPFVVSD